MAAQSAKIKREDQPRGGASDWIGNVVVRAIIGIALTLPLQTRLRMVSWLMRRVVAGPSRYRARAEANLHYIWPERPAPERARIADAALDNAARTLIENYDVPGLLARMAQVTPDGPGLSAIETAQADGRPVLFVTGHYGNFEAARAALIARGYRIGGLYRPLANPYLNAHYAKNMHALSEPVFEQGTRGTIGLLRHLKAGGMGVLLFDIYDSAGLPIPFLGKPAPTLLSAAEIALKTNAIVVPFFGIRQPDGCSFKPVFEAPLQRADAATMTQEMTARLEARIAQDPGQWFWIHRRWKPKRQAKRQRKAAAPKMAP